MSAEDESAASRAQPGGSGSRGASWGTSWATNAALGLALGLVALGVVRLLLHAPVIDDALIAARYARNLLRHGELAFNPGERVEGYTSFSWVVATAWLSKLGISPANGVVVLSFFSGALGAALLSLWFGRRDGPFTALAGAASLLVLPGWFCWAQSGLDACGFALLWTAALLAYVHAVTRRRCALNALLACAAAVTRPEGILLPLVWLIHEAAWGRSARRFLWSAGLFALLFGAWFAWRWAYFGSFLPNTYYAKVGEPGLALAARGARYLGGFALAALPLLVPSAMALARPRSREIDTARLLAAATILLALLGIVATGGDYFPLYRFGVPLLPGLVILAWLGLGRLKARARGGLLAAAVLSAFLFGGGVPDFRAEAHHVVAWREMGRALAERFPRATVAAYFIGAIGYYSDLPVIDMLGLTDRTIAHRRQVLGRGDPGHEKFDNLYVLDRRPEVIVLDGAFYQERRPPQLSDFWGAAAPDMYQQPRFQETYEARDLPIGVVYFRIFVRRASARLAEPGGNQPISRSQPAPAFPFGSPE